PRPPPPPLFPYTTLFRSISTHRRSRRRLRRRHRTLGRPEELCVHRASTRSPLAYGRSPYTVNVLNPATYTLLFAIVGGLNFVARSEEHTSELQSRFDLVC